MSEAPLRQTARRILPGKPPVPPKGRPGEVVIRCDPAELEHRPSTFRERFRRGLEVGLPGFAASLGVHCVLLVLLMFLAIQLRPRGTEWALRASWLEEAAESAATDESAPQQAAGRQPIRIESFAVGPDDPSPQPTSAPAASVPQIAAATPPPVAPVDVSGLFSGRSTGRRSELLAEAGGDDAVVRAIEAGLAWLARQQQPSGAWQLHQGYPDAGYPNLRTDSGATAMALLAFLGEGHTHHSGTHRDAVRKGLDWLVGVQKPNGDLHDHSELGRRTAFYAHAMATTALAEACALSSDRTLRTPLERAVAFLLESQHPARGGWKYQPLNDERSVGDLSVTGWALMALHSARAAGVDVSHEAFARSSLFLDSVQDAATGRCRYMPNPAEPLTAAMTAEGLLCRQFLGWPADEPRMQAALSELLAPANQPHWSAGRRNVYAWYYTAQVLHHLGGQQWQRWYGEAAREIVQNQAKTGAVRGSWNPAAPVGADHEYAREGGRLYLTAFCLLILETPYRHRPVFSAER